MLEEYEKVKSSFLQKKRTSRVENMEEEEKKANENLSPNNEVMTIEEEKKLRSC